eukprot:110426-Pleurochrysis_carterae.AAC.1
MLCKEVGITALLVCGALDVAETVAAQRQHVHAAPLGAAAATTAAPNAGPVASATSGAMSSKGPTSAANDEGANGPQWRRILSRLVARQLLLGARRRKNFESSS